VTLFCGRVPAVDIYTLLPVRVRGAKKSRYSGREAAAAVTLLNALDGQLERGLTVAFDADLLVARRHDAHMFIADAIWRFDRRQGRCWRWCKIHDSNVTADMSDTVRPWRHVARVLAALSQPMPREPK
jgi:hypothetical protein